MTRLIRFLIQKYFKSELQHALESGYRDAKLSGKFAYSDNAILKEELKVIKLKRALTRILSESISLTDSIKVAREALKEVDNG